MFINNNTLQAINGATLLLSTSINNAGGLISAQNGSTVVQSGVTLSGGTLATVAVLVRSRLSVAVPTS